MEQSPSPIFLQLEPLSLCLQNGSVGPTPLVRSSGQGQSGSALQASREGRGSLSFPTLPACHFLALPGPGTGQPTLPKVASEPGPLTPETRRRTSGLTAGPPQSAWIGSHGLGASAQTSHRGCRGARPSSVAHAAVGLSPVPPVPAVGPHGLLSGWRACHFWGPRGHLGGWREGDGESRGVPRWERVRQS